ncbi:MAG: hypothetical protein PUG12_07760 [Prevotella sp.]|nr:hypothetical protein [Prevotella sp.]
MSIKKLLMMTLLSLCWVSVFAEDDTNVLFKWTATASTNNETLKVWSLKNQESGTAQYSWVSSATDNNGFVIDNNEGYYFSTGAWNRMMMIDKESFKAEEIKNLQNNYTDLTVAVTVNYLRDGNQTDSDPAQISLKYYNSSEKKWEGFCDFGENKDYKSLTSDGSVTVTITKNLATEYDMAVEGKHLKIKSVIISYFSKELAKERNKQYLPEDPKKYVDADIKPYYIASWYQKESTNPISFSSVSGQVQLGDVMRVCFRGAVEDSYAFLKDWKTSNEIMTGSDKFSINGWKYMDITVNQKLKDLIDNDDLWIGGNNYTISGIYFLHDDKNSYEDWQDRGAEVRSTYTPSDAEKKLTNWNSFTVPGKFFTYKDGEESKGKIDNTKNAIIRINYTTNGEGAQIAVKDNGSNTDGSYGSYSRNRQEEKSGSYIYYDYFDLTSDTGNFDIVFSDAITKFKENKSSGQNEPVIGPDGQMTGMMSKIQRDGILVSGKNVTINSVSIIPTQVAKYVSGCAVINHKLSAKYYKPISLSCNMDDPETIKSVFGTDNVYELGTTEVKKESNSTKGNDYHIYIHFNKATSIRANYPYIIKLDGNDDESTFTYDGVKANTRDYTTYTFYTPAFTYDESITDDEKAKFEEYLEDQQMLFISTAPVIKMKTSSGGEVEVITGVDDYTKLNTYNSSTGGTCDYYFYKGVLYPNMQDRSIKSGLAYIQLTENLKKVFDNPKVVFGQTQAKNGAFYSFVLDADNTVTGISSLPACNPRRANVNGVYNLNGQRVTASADELQHLPAGIYIVNGHKLVVR